MSDTGRQRSARPRAPTSRYDEDGIEAARKLVFTAAGADAAAAFALIARLHQVSADQSTFDLTAFDAAGWQGAGLKNRLRAAACSFQAAFGLPLLAGLDQSGDAIEHPTLEIARDLLELLGRDPVAPVATTAILDADATVWVAMVAAAARSGQGHHLALRCGDDDWRGVRDFAAHVAATGVRIIYVQARERLRAAVLAAELFGWNDTVVVVDDYCLTEAVKGGHGQDLDAPLEMTVLTISPALAGMVSWLESLRTTYVWRIPDKGILPPDLRHLIAACFGPLRQDPGWRAAHVKGLATGIDAHAARLLLGQVGDARDVAAMARLAVAVASDPFTSAATVAEACALLVGRSPRRSHVEPLLEPVIDASLLACDPDGLALLERGHALAQGGRVLVWGPPGGGKSTFAKMLAARVAEAAAGAAPIVVEPASLFARGWGATERLIAALWERAHQTVAPLVADEFDSLAGAREIGAPTSGNTHLVRVSTNEWLRQLDAYPGVALIVTVNDLEVLDPAIKRRFPVAVEVRDELSSDQEYHAWEVLFKMTPPADWRPIGASVSDYASALERCRLIGVSDPESYAAALAKTRAVRMRPTSGAGRSKRKVPLQ